VRLLPFLYLKKFLFIPSKKEKKKWNNFAVFPIFRVEK
jgi:hypothetical protein